MATSTPRVRAVSFVRPFPPAGTGGRHLKRLLLRLLLLVGAVGLPVTCVLATGVLAQGAVRIVDAAGDTLTLRAPARRVVSLLPPATELFFALGAGDRVVGRSRWCVEPAAAVSVPDLGEFLPPAVEPIVARDPDLVVLYHAGATAAVAARLRAMGIPVLRVRIDRLDDLPRAAAVLGRATGRAATADSLMQQWRAAFAPAPPSVSMRAPRVLILAWADPPIALGRGAVQSELVERAGGRNVFADIAAASGPVSIEAIVARDPELVVLPPGTAAAALDAPAWRAVRAVRQGRILTIDHSAFTWPSLRAPAVVERLAERLQAAVALVPR